MAGHGGKRPGAGRPKGSKDKATAEHKKTLEALARDYTDVALDTLAHVAQFGESEAARVSAANALLDRGYGKCSQTVSGDPDNPVQHKVKVEFVSAAKT